MAEEKEVGKVVHYFDRIMVVVLELKGNIEIGDKVKFLGDKEEFEQEVKSIQIEHNKVKKAKKGEDVAVKVEKPVKKGWLVYKLKE